MFGFDTYFGTLFGTLLNFINDVCAALLLLACLVPQLQAKRLMLLFYLHLYGLAAE